MSWNAAKRALALGYTHVAWYPEGTDGWAAADLPLEPRDTAATAACVGVSYSSACWMVRARVNSRCSIVAGTSQA